MTASNSAESAKPDSSVTRKLETFRGYLLQIAERSIQPDLRGKLSASDLTQETLWEASRQAAKLAGKSDEHYRRWLRRILRNNLRDAERRYLADKRTAQREVSVEEAAVLAQLASGDSAAAGAIFERRELENDLERAIASLPRTHQEIIRLRNRENLPFAEIAVRLELTENAAQKLWARAVVGLREALQRR